jgi:hypothetical protein
MWRVRVFAPRTAGAFTVTVHVAPPAAVQDQPAAYLARIDPAHKHTDERAGISGPLQVSIAGGDWGYVCDEHGTYGFGDGDSAANAACVQMYQAPHYGAGGSGVGGLWPRAEADL